MNRCIHFPFIILLVVWRNQSILGSDVDLVVTDTTCVGNNVTLKCTINPFTTVPSATWSRNGSNALTTCTSVGPCTQDDLTIDGVKYSFSGGSTGIQVAFQIQLEENGIEWICSHNATPYRYTFEVNTCQADAESSKPLIVGSVTAVALIGVEGPICYLIGKLICSEQCCLSCCIPFTFIVALTWCYSLSRRYVFNGRVIYGIQFVIVAAISQPITIISAVIVLTKYKEQNESYATTIMLILIPFCALLADGTYLLCKAFCGQKEWTYNKFEDDLKHFSLLKDHSIKFDTINKDKIWFKVWAKDDVLMTLFGKNAIPFLNIIIGYGKRHRKFSSKAFKPVVACDDVLGTDYKYRIFYLTCEKHVVTVVKVLNGEEETVLKWPDTNSSEPLDRMQLDISDIKISNYMQDLKNEVDTADTKSQTGTRGEWIFFIRQGDGLHEDDDDSRFCKNLMLFLVILIPVAWIVVPILLLKKCIMPCAKETKNSKVSSAMIIKNRKDTNGKEEEEGQPNDAMITTENVWINTPIGRKMPDLPAIEMTKQTDAGTEDTKQKKKKKKSKNQNKDSNRKDFQQSQEDTENNTVQTVAD